MWGGKEFTQAVLAFAAGIYVSLFCIVLLSADRLPALCSIDDSRCLRDWLAALSGWAAFFGAAGSLPFLMGQWREARRQTRFIVGDEEPSFDVVTHLKEQNILVLRIVNWNRRGLIVRNVKIISSRVESRDEAARWLTVVDGIEVSGDSDFHLYGWEDRSGAPSHAKIDLVLRRRFLTGDPPVCLEESIPFPSDTVVVVRIQKLGNVHEISELKADAFPRSDL